MVLGLAADLQGVVVESLFVHQLQEHGLGPIHVVTRTMKTHLREGRGGGVERGGEGRGGEGSGGEGGRAELKIRL